MHFNRWILGGLGFALRGPIGALIGVTIAILLEEKLEKLDKDQPAEDQPKDNDRRFVGGESPPTTVVPPWGTSVCRCLCSSPA